MNDAINRANHRASVVSSLDEKYSKGISIEAALTVTKENNTGNNRSNSETISVVNAIQNLFCDSSERTTNILREQLVGKSIIIENVKQQTEASKAVTKLKKELKRKKSISNSALKKIRKENMPNSNSVLLSDLQMLNSLWNHYIVSVIKFSKSDAQLQARLVSAELVGAKCTLASAFPPTLQNAKGIIVEETKNCYFIAITSDESNIKIKNKNKRKKRRNRNCEEANIDEVLSQPKLLSSNHDNDNDSTKNMNNNDINDNSTIIKSINFKKKQQQEEVNIIQIIKSKNTLAIELPYIYNDTKVNSIVSNDISNDNTTTEQNQPHGNICIVGYNDRLRIPEKCNNIR